MGYNPIEVSQAASQVLDKLRKSGAVGHTEISQNVLLDGVFEVPEVESGPSAFECRYLEIKVGDNVTVKWNGVQYTCVAFDIEGSIGFGNLAVMGADINTGEPFLFSNAVYEDDTSAGIFLTYEHGSVTVTVSVTTEIVHPITPKFLGEVVLPVVEIADITAITLEESLAITSLGGRPIIVKSSDETGSVGIVCSYISRQDGVRFYSGLAASNVFVLRCDDGVAWYKA